MPILNHQCKTLLYANYVSLQLKHYCYAERYKPEALLCQSEIYDQRVGHSVFCDLFSVKAGFCLKECNDSAEVARVGACVGGSNVDSPSAALGRIG